jgi:hypothetical protein
MNRATARERIEHAIDRGCGQRAIARVAGDVGLVHLEAIAGQSRDLLRQHSRDRHHQFVKRAVVAVQQRARQHVRAGHRELERPARDCCRELAIGQQIQ